MGILEFVCCERGKYGPKRIFNEQQIPSHINIPYIYLKKKKNKKNEKNIRKKSKGFHLQCHEQKPIGLM